MRVRETSALDPSSETDQRVEEAEVRRVQGNIQKICSEKRPFFSRRTQNGENGGVAEAVRPLLSVTGSATAPSAKMGFSAKDAAPKSHLFMCFSPCPVWTSQELLREQHLFICSIVFPGVCQLVGDTTGFPFKS